MASNRGKVLFQGIIPDTGCSHDSTGGLVHYHAYCRYTGTQPRIDPTRRVFHRFGKGTAVSIGCAEIRFPFRDRYLSFNLCIVLTHCEILLSHGDMNRLGITYDNIERVIKHPNSGTSVPVTVEDDTPFIRWDPIRDDPIRYKQLQLRKQGEDISKSNTKQQLSLHHRFETENQPNKKRHHKQENRSTHQLLLSPPPSCQIPEKAATLKTKGEQNTRKTSRLRREQWL